MELSVLDPSVPDSSHSKFGLFTGYIFVINTCIGAGFLSIPWAFATSGWFFCLIYETLVSVQGYIICMMILESMSRVEVLLTLADEGEVVPLVPFHRLFSKAAHKNTLIRPRLKPIIANRMLNCSDITKLVFGKRLGMVYLVLFYLFQLGTLVAYITIFASSFASNVPLGNNETCDIYATSTFYNTCRWKYWVFLVFYAVITVYLTIRGMEEQRIFQLFMMVLRFIVMFLIIITSIVDIASESSNQDSSHNSASWPPLITPMNVGHAIPIIFFASNFQLQMPTLTQAINNKSHNLPRINLLASITCFVLYTSLGLLVSVSVKNVPSMASLAYRNYTAGHSLEDRPAWTYAIEYFIVLTPAIDVISAYPTQSLPIADALISWKHGGRVEEVKKRERYLMRFVMALMPFFLAFFEYNLGTILDWVGLVGFLITQIPIPLFHIALRHMVPGDSPYDINIHPIVSWITIVVNLMLFFLVIGMNFAEI